DRKSTRLNSSHVSISYAVFCLKKKKRKTSFFQYIKEAIFSIFYVKNMNLIHWNYYVYVYLHVEHYMLLELASIHFASSDATHQPTTILCCTLPSTFALSSCRLICICGRYSRTASIRPLN